MALQRSSAGSFLPSPPRSARNVSVEWASPVPRKNSDANVVPLDCDFELSIQEVGAAKGSLASQLDTDQPGRATAESFSRHRSRFEMEQIVASPGSLPKPMS